MLTGLYQSIIVLLIVIAYYVMDFSLITSFDKKRRAEGSGRNWRYTTLVVVMVAALIFQPVLLPWLSWYTSASWGLALQVVGILFNIGALGLHMWSRLHLRQFYAERVELQPGHVIVDTGPYAYVRHPVFTSFFMHVIGLFLINPSVPTVLMMIYTFWDFSRAASKEERLLSKNVPAYNDYIGRTSKFFPWFK